MTRPLVFWAIVLSVALAMLSLGIGTGEALRCIGGRQTVFLPCS